MPLADIQLQVDNAVKQGVLNEANAQRFVADVSKSKEAQDKLQGVDIPEANQDKAIDLQKEIDQEPNQQVTGSVHVREWRNGSQDRSATQSTD